MHAVRFLFWNLYKKELFDEICNIVEHHQVDVLVMAEVEFGLANLVSILAKRGQNFFHNPISQCKKIQILTRFDASFLQPVSDHNRYTINILTLPLLEKILVAAVHVPDKSHNRVEDQEVFCRSFVNEIQKIEKEKNIAKTIVVGDFNMNPFEAPMLNATSFHAISSSQVAERQTRKIQEENYRFFYNPMWSLQGDIGNNVTGSHYYNTSNYMNYFWNTFDQVLIRPELIPNFDKQNLKILDSDGNQSLLTKNGLPDSKFSDHLPLFFTLNLHT